MTAGPIRGSFAPVTQTPLMLLLLKLVLAPALVGLATLVARRWGPTIGGIVVGFPLSTGPIFLFLTLDQGLDFAERATVGILYGLTGVVGFALVYAAAARHSRWPGALFVGIVAFFVVSAGVSLIGGGLAGAALAAYAALLLAIVVIPRPRGAMGKAPPPWWDIWLRMIAASLLTLAITGAAGQLGPMFSGIMGTFPVVSTVVVSFTHHQWGAEAAIAVLRGSVLSWFSFVSCFLTIGLTLSSYGLAVSLVLGAASIVATSVVVLWIDRTMAKRRSAP